MSVGTLEDGSKTSHGQTNKYDSQSNGTMKDQSRESDGQSGGRIS